MNHALKAAPQRNLVLGALASRKVSAPRLFIETLKASGADADVVVFVHDIAPEIERYLRDNGVTLVPFRHWRPWNGPVHAWRYVLFARYATQHQAQYRAILTSDLRDVLFQSDPFAQMPDARVRFFLECGTYTHGTTHHYAKWLRIFANRQLREALWDKPVSCCGVTIGGATEMAAYLDAMARWIKRVPPIIRQRLGADSIAHNVLAYTGRQMNGVVEPNNGLVATMGLEPPGVYVVDAKGRFATQDGHVSAICHQYDRLPGLFAQSRYASAP